MRGMRQNPSKMKAIPIKSVKKITKHSNFAYITFWWLISQWNSTKRSTPGSRAHTIDCALFLIDCRCWGSTCSSSPPSRQPRSSSPTISPTQHSGGNCSTGTFSGKAARQQWSLFRIAESVGTWPFFWIVAVPKAVILVGYIYSIFRIRKCSASFFLWKSQPII